MPSPENENHAAELRAKVIASRKGVNLNHTGQNFATKPAITTPPPGSEAEITYDLPSEDLFSPEKIKAAAKAAARAGPNGLDKEMSNARRDSMQPPPKPIARPEQDLTLAKPIAAAVAKYPDLELWLEMTRYHDVQHRNAKLASYKERRAIEQQATNIRGRLQQHNQGGGFTTPQTSVPPLKPRFLPKSTEAEAAPHSAVQGSAPVFSPRSAVFFPTPRKQAPSGGTPRLARTRSISPPAQNARPNNSGPKLFPAHNPPVYGRRRSPPGLDLQRHVSYPDRRSRSPVRRAGNGMRDSRRVTYPDRRRSRSPPRRDRDRSLERGRQYRRR